MRFILFLVIVFELSSCSSGKNDNTNSSISANEVAAESELLTDSIPNIKNIVSDSFPLSSELIIYPFHKIEMSNNSKTGFIPLGSGGFDPKDTSIIENKYLGMTEYEDYNYHILKHSYRSQFLKKKNINESDIIYIYNTILDSLEIYNVNDISIIAFITLYGGSYGGVRPGDYKIGFELKNNAIASNNFTNTLVYIGEYNPFMNGNLKPIKWKKIETKELPLLELNTQDSIHLFRYKNQKIISTYSFKNESYEYFIQNIGEEGITYIRYLKIISLNDNNTLFSKVFFESEGTYLKPLNGLNKNNDEEEQVYQWTGKLFKNRAPVIFGFLGWSFGCPKIQFIDNSERDIDINCDNRH